VLRLSELTTIEIQPPKSGNKPVLEQRSGATYFLNRSGREKSSSELHKRRAQFAARSSISW
jgi:hypothetical protein